MRKRLLLLGFITALPLYADIDYPTSKTVAHTDNYHGTDVADPYRWLEEDVRNSEAVANWVDAQNAVTRAYVEPLPERQKVIDKLNEIWNYERVGTPEQVGDKLFFYRNSGLQNQSAFYVQQGEKGEPRLLIDPNEWADDGTQALGGTVVSPKGKYVAYAIQDGGSDWRTWKVLEVKTGKTLSDELTWLKFNQIAWDADETGFFYARFPEPSSGGEFQSLNLNMAVYHHQLGQPQSQDELVYTNADNPEWGYNTAVSDNGRWLIITVWHGTDNRYQLLVKDLKKANAKPEWLVQGFEHEYAYIGSRGDTAYFSTTLNAPLGRVISRDLSKGAKGQWQEVVAEAESNLQSVALAKQHLLLHYLEDAKSVLYSVDGKGKRSEIELPGVGQVSAWDANTDSNNLYYSFASFNYPTTQFAYDLAANKNRLVKQPEVKFDPTDFVVKQVFYTSKDGTRVPMFISHHKDVKPNGEQPTILYGYGGFNISMLPRFSLPRLAWMMMGGVYAQANIRGGGEYGEAWHKAGTKLQKQNVFDDFIAAGEHLISSGYTNPDKLAVWGGSNGGLLVGAVVNQRPDLFAAAIPQVGVMDMLRFQKFTAGRYWVDDYGSSDNPEEFKALYAYSPYHNLKKGTEYPAVMVTTADTDDRVVPGHSFKYIARLQAVQSGDAPVLIRIETRAGHGAGIPTEKTIALYGDLWAFLADNLNMQSRL